MGFVWADYHRVGDTGRRYVFKLHMVAGTGDVVTKDKKTYQRKAGGVVGVIGVTALVLVIAVLIKSLYRSCNIEIIISLSKQSSKNRQKN